MFWCVHHWQIKINDKAICINLIFLKTSILPLIPYLMSAIDNPESIGPDWSFNIGGVTVTKEEDEQKRSPKGKAYIANVPANHTQTGGAKDKGVQYLVLSMVGYLCASIVFGFLLNKNRKESNAYSSK